MFRTLMTKSKSIKWYVLLLITNENLFDVYFILLIRVFITLI